ncbi:hypothetical protein JYJ95_40540 [Corallococcus exiguus]|uniref:hypothetical protein n=1 Tax=Corallococcus exiguus TaxID=83462 RepID=UPI001A8CB1B9|nr:hypothetical protein [Corallococcus exiguus]MBN8472832.1 hypothetical protein [Corallococcus exiguus]
MPEPLGNLAHRELQIPRHVSPICQDVMLQGASDEGADLQAGEPRRLPVQDPHARQLLETQRFQWLRPREGRLPGIQPVTVVESPTRGDVAVRGLNVCSREHAWAWNLLVEPTQR